MTFIHDFHLHDFISKINCLITFLEFFSFVHITSKLNISSNYTEYLKKLVPYYILLLFTILKSLYPISQPICLKKDDFSFAKKKLSHTKKLGLQSFY